jgi:hypothetical protein
VAYNTQDSDSKVRDYVYGETVDIVQGWENNALRVGDTKFAAYIRKSWQPYIDALREDREVIVHGWELPDDHWARALGVDRSWTLTADDRLVPRDDPQFVPPNRAQRRAMGQRGNGLNGQAD